MWAVHMTDDQQRAGGKEPFSRATILQGNKVLSEAGKKSWNKVAQAGLIACFTASLTSLLK